MDPCTSWSCVGLCTLSERRRERSGGATSHSVVLGATPGRAHGIMMTLSSESPVTLYLSIVLLLGTISGVLRTSAGRSGLWRCRMQISVAAELVFLPAQVLACVQFGSDGTKAYTFAHEQLHAFHLGGRAGIEGRARLSACATVVAVRVPICVHTCSARSMHFGVPRPPFVHQGGA